MLHKITVFLSCVFFLVSSVQAEVAKQSIPVKVGVILPLTGPLAEYGVAFQNGLTLAQRDSAEVAGNCAFKIEDSKYDSKTAVGIFQKFSQADKISIVYNWGGPTSEAIAPLADRNDVALFVFAVDPRVGEGKARVIRFANSGLDYGSVVAGHLEKQGIQEIGIVKTDNQYIEAILGGVKASMPKAKIELIDTYQPTDLDFKSTISKIKARKYQALGVFLLSSQVSQFTKQLRAQSITLPIFGTDFFESMSEVQQSNGGMVGAVFSNNEVTGRFRDNYVKKFGNELQINHAANGYDFANFLCRQLGSDIKNLSSLQLIERVSGVETLQGEQGKATFVRSEKGDKYFKFPVVVRRIEAFKIVTMQ